LGGPAKRRTETNAWNAGAMASFTTEDDSGHFIYLDGTSAHNWFWASSDGRTLTYHFVGMKKDHCEFQQTLVYNCTK